jgi:hypothetical protein
MYTNIGRVRSTNEMEVLDAPYSEPYLFIIHCFTNAPYDLVMAIPSSATFVKSFFRILDTGHEPLAISRQLDEYDVRGIWGDQGLGCALNVR